MSLGEVSGERRNAIAVWRRAKKRTVRAAVSRDCFSAIHARSVLRRARCNGVEYLRAQGRRSERNRQLAKICAPSRGHPPRSNETASRGGIAEPARPPGLP